MSDHDDPEGFDREAQKRELREKYAKDAEDRERTGRMSELLLQGATMTNKHCDRCGNPLFRYEGREFCPTCQAEGEATEADEAAEAAADADATEIEVTDTSADASDADAKSGEPAGTGVDAQAGVDAQSSADAPADAGVERAAGAEADDASAASTGAPTRSLTPDVDAESPEEHTHDVTAEAHAAGHDAARRGRDAPGRERVPEGDASPARRDADAPTDGVAGARASLSRSVSALAERAAAADDPRNARELAAAAREAAEALDALR